MNDAAQILEVSSLSHWRRPTRSMSPARLAGVTAGLVLATVLPVAIEAAAQESESVAARIARENLPSVVTLVALDDRDQPLALGSGFFITSDGVLVTNAHVVGGAARVLVRWRGQNGVAVKILNFARKYDLVTIQTSFASTPPVLLADSETAAAGQDIIVLGSPQGLEGTVSTGIIGGLRTIGGVRYLQITAPISPGSSGGPVFNTQGRVIGISTATSAKGQNLNFALPANLLRDVPPASIAFTAAKPTPFDLRDGDRLKDLVYFNNIMEEFGFFAEGSTLTALTASLQNRTGDTISDVRVLVVVKSPRGEVLDFHLRDFKGTVIPPGLGKQVAIPIATRGFRMWGTGIDYDRGSYEIRLLDYKVVSSRADDPIKRR
ncbi:MAG: S1C family serine protease [Candidatus Rokuibacteriota bacterium]